MKIIVGMSGGVDSSVTALLLKESGHEVIGIIMSIWSENNSFKTNGKDACYGPNEKEDIKEAQRICDELKIPLHIIDCVEKYEKIVLENFRNEYSSGRTPNPCIWCNSLVKFGALPLLAEQSGITYDKFATGHYAKVIYDNGRYLLKNALDTRKDQTYFLYRLTQEQLSRVIFPLGDYTKEEVRKIAGKNNLHVCDKEESQDFYSGDYNELLKLEPKQGNIVDKQRNILGTHSGTWNYTLGQRKGLGIAAKMPLYVIELDNEKNEVIVGYEKDTYQKTLVANELNWIAIDELSDEIQIKAKIRSSQTAKDAIIKPYTNNEVHVEFDDYQKAITTGQSVVFYQNDIVLGGGIINQVIKST